MDMSVVVQDKLAVVLGNSDTSAVLGTSVKSLVPASVCVRVRSAGESVRTPYFPHCTGLGEAVVGGGDAALGV